MHQCTYSGLRFRRTCLRSPFCRNSNTIITYNIQQELDEGWCISWSPTAYRSLVALVNRPHLWQFTAVWEHLDGCKDGKKCWTTVTLFCGSQYTWYHHGKLYIHVAGYITSQQTECDLVSSLLQCYKFAHNWATSVLSTCSVWSKDSWMCSYTFSIL